MDGANLYDGNIEGAFELWIEIFIMQKLLVILSICFRLAGVK